MVNNANLKVDKKTIELIVLDLDGTTLNDEGQLTETTQKAFRSAMDKGVQIVIATGRVISSIPEAITKFKGMRYILTSNGAHIIDLEKNESVYSNFIDKKAVETAMALLRNYDYMLEIFIQGLAYVDRIDYDKVRNGIITYRNSQYVIKTRTPVDNLLDFASAHTSEIENINVNFQDLSEKPRMNEILCKLPKVTITSSFEHNLEIGGETTSKGTAVAELCKRLGISLENVMACGDSPNDISMLEEVGLPIAVGNAKPEVKAVSKHIVSSNHENGVAEAIERFVLHSS